MDDKVSIVEQEIRHIIHAIPEVRIVSADGLSGSDYNFCADDVTAEITMDKDAVISFGVRGNPLPDPIIHYFADYLAHIIPYLGKV